MISTGDSSFEFIEDNRIPNHVIGVIGYPNKEKTVVMYKDGTNRVFECNPEETIEKLYAIDQDGKWG